MEREQVRQSSVLLGRVLGFIEIADLLSGRKFTYAEIAARIAQRYSFQKFPSSLEQFDITKGVDFLDGLSSGYAIQKFAIWDTLLVLETNVSTKVSQAILEDILLWGSKDIGLNYKPGSIKRFGYISDVTFFSDAPLLDLHTAVRNVATRTSKELSRIWQEPVTYEPLTMRVGHDPTARKNAIAPFSIEHRAETKFSENKYFSEAPLPTDVHWEVLEQFEKDILAVAARG